MQNIRNFTPKEKLIISKGLLDYEYIMNNWKTNNKDFQDVFYSFYLKARWAAMSKEQNLSAYFDLLNSYSNSTNVQREDLMSIVNALSEDSKEFSICSKLLHTINPDCPIYDSKVRMRLSNNINKVEFWWQRDKGMYGKGAPRKTSVDEKIDHDWKVLCDWYDNFLTSSIGQQWIELFDQTFPNYTNISDVKKIDCIIFATT